MVLCGGACPAQGRGGEAVRLRRDRAADAAQAGRAGSAVSDWAAPGGGASCYAGGRASGWKNLHQGRWETG